MRVLLISANTENITMVPLPLGLEEWLSTLLPEWMKSRPWCIT